MITKRFTILIALLSSASTLWAAPKDKTPPTAPSNMHVTGISDYSVSLSWGPSTDNSGFWYYKLVSSAGPTVDLDRTQTSYSFTTSHNAGATYSFYVYAIDGAGNKSANSNTVSAKLLPAGTLPSAPALSVTDVGPTHVSLAWTAPFNAGPPARYWLYLNGQAIVIGGQTTTYTLYYTNPQTVYSFTVQVRDGKGRFSPQSSVLNVTTPATNPNDVTPPSTPLNLWAGTFSDGSAEFDLYWSASTDDFTAPQFIRYDVYLNGAFLTTTVGLTHLTDYAEFGDNTIQLIAIDEAGNASAAATTTLHAP